MHVDYLIIGQGISGTWLSYYLQKARQSFLVVDNNRPNTASRVAAGIINPVTGRRMVTTWMIDELLPFIRTAYEELGSELGITAISGKNILDFFPSPFMRESFLKRASSPGSYLQLPEEEKPFSKFFHYEFGLGEISPAYTVHLETILPAWRNVLRSKNSLLEEDFETDRLNFTGGGIEYKNIHAGKIIFCDGVTSATNPWFRNLPFAFNKGEALIIEAAGLPKNFCYKKGIFLAPLAGAGSEIFWAGSNYTWNFQDDQPSKTFREETERHLKSWLKIPFTILHHSAAIRPANVERRPFVGLHPGNKHIGILNGMGTKGCSLAPYFARQLVHHLVNKTEILPEAEISRFSKILLKSI